MKRLGMLFGLALLVLMAASAQASTPYYLFGMSARGLLYMNSSVTTTMQINAFHGSSETWKFYIEGLGSDNPPYDNITIQVDCTSGDSAVFDTTDYPEWVEHGYLEIPLIYEDEDDVIRYNSIPLESKTVRCDFTALGFNFTNNTAYNTRKIHMIPYLASIEFIECTGFDDNFGISFTGDVMTLVTMMEDCWEIAWYTYSIFAIIFVVIGVPLLVFIILRWAIYRLTGYKLIERRER